MDKGIIIPTDKPSRARITIISQMLLSKKADVPLTMYSVSDPSTIARVVNRRQSKGKMNEVMMMNSAGTLTSICTQIGLRSAKCAWITSRAGAIAAPAITVSNEIERIAVASSHLLECLSILAVIKQLYMCLRSTKMEFACGSASPFSAAKLAKKTEWRAVKVAKKAEP